MRLIMQRTVIIMQTQCILMVTGTISIQLQEMIMKIIMQSLYGNRWILMAKVTMIMI
jgi:hypothetical protein